MQLTNAPFKNSILFFIAFVGLVLWGFDSAAPPWEQ